MNINISKKLLIISATVAVVLLAVVIIGYTLAFSAFVKSEINHLKNELYADYPYSSAKLGFITDAQKSSKFTLLEYNGKIGVYDSDSYELLEILDVYVITLPDADKKMLENGIDATSVKELISLVEDYTS